MIEIEAQLYVGKSPISKGIRELYGGLQCLPFTSHLLDVSGEHLRNWLRVAREVSIETNLQVFAACKTCR